MKEFMKRLKNYGFWSALLLGLIPLVAQAFGIPLPVEFPDIINAVLGLLVMLGLLSNPKEGKGFGDIGRELKPKKKQKKDDIHP